MDPSAGFLVLLVMRRPHLFRENKMNWHVKGGWPSLSSTTLFQNHACSRRDGFILIAVIWIAGLLAVASTAFSVSMRSHIIYGRNAVSGEKVKSVADGLVRLAAWRVAASPSTMIVVPDGGWTACRWGDASLWISIQDQSGLVDLNMASPALMRALLEGLGLSTPDAMRMEMSMRDYRDADKAAMEGGDEPALYPGRAFGPKNAPFSTVEELDQIPGMTSDLFGKLIVLTSVDSEQTGVSFETAPVALLRALKLERPAGDSSPYSAPAASQVLAVKVAVHLPDGARFVRQALIAPLRQPKHPFAITKWISPPWPSELDKFSSKDTVCSALP